MDGEANSRSAISRTIYAVLIPARTHTGRPACTTHPINISRECVKGRANDTPRRGGRQKKERGGEVGACNRFALANALVVRVLFNSTCYCTVTRRFPSDVSRRVTALQGDIFSGERASSSSRASASSRSRELPADCRAANNFRRESDALRASRTSRVAVTV